MVNEDFDKTDAAACREFVEGKDKIFQPHIPAFILPTLINYCLSRGRGYAPVSVVFRCFALWIVRISLYSRTNFRW